MGLGDFLDNVRMAIGTGSWRDTLREAKELFIDEPCGMVRDFGQEAHELLSDGFSELVVHGGTEYQTSFEKQEEADKVIRNATKKFERELNKLSIQQAKSKDTYRTYCNYSYSVIEDVVNIWNRVSNTFFQPSEYCTDEYASINFSAPERLMSEALKNSSKGQILAPPKHNHLNRKGSSLFGRIATPGVAKNDRVKRANDRLFEAQKYSKLVDIRIEAVHHQIVILTEFDRRITENTKIIDRFYNHLYTILGGTKGEKSSISRALNFSDKMLALLHLVVSSLCTIYQNPLLDDEGIPMGISNSLKTDLERINRKCKRKLID